MNLFDYDAEILSAARRWHKEMLKCNAAGVATSDDLNDAIFQLVAALKADADNSAAIRQNIIEGKPNARA